MAIKKWKTIETNLIDHWITFVKCCIKADLTASSAIINNNNRQCEQCTFTIVDCILYINMLNVECRITPTLRDEVKPKKISK